MNFFIEVKIFPKFQIFVDLKEKFVYFAIINELLSVHPTVFLTNSLRFIALFRFIIIP